MINDIGEKLECGGVMTSLRRTSSSGFDIKQCYTLEQIQKYSDDDNLSHIIMPVESAFNSTYDKVSLNTRCTQLYKNGVKLRLEQAGIQGISNDKTVCIYDCDNVFFRTC